MKQNPALGSTKCTVPCQKPLPDELHTKLQLYESFTFYNPAFISPSRPEQNIKHSIAQNNDLEQNTPIRTRPEPWNHRQQTPKGLPIGLACPEPKQPSSSLANRVRPRSPSLSLRCWSEPIKKLQTFHIHYACISRVCVCIASALCRARLLDKPKGNNCC